MNSQLFNQIRVTTNILILLFSINLFILFKVEAEIKRGAAPIPVIDSKRDQIILYRESHALIVGISEYSNGWPMLPGVKNDIKHIEFALRKNGFRTVVLSNPSHDVLRKAIESFINEYGQESGNRLLFYFAGHGHTLKLSFGEYFPAS